MYHVEIEGYMVLATKSHLRARLEFAVLRLLFPHAVILIDFDGIICD